MTKLRIAGVLAVIALACAGVGSARAQSYPGFTPLDRAKNLADLPNIATARTNLGLGALATLSAVTVPLGGTGAASFTAGLPILGNGTSALTTGTLSGSTTDFGTVNGALVNGNCLSADANGNIVDNGAPCGTGGTGSGTVTSVGTGTGLTGGPITSAGSLSVATGGITNALLGAGAVTDSKVNAAAAIDSGKLQFVPSWASSVPRTVTSKNMDIVNLADFMPAGQACDGTHDISAGLTAAAAALTNGGVINIPVGTCPIVSGADFEASAPITLAGQGGSDATAGTVLDCSGFTGTSGSACITFGDSDGGGMHDMKVDGGGTMAGGTFLLMIHNGAFQMSFHDMYMSHAPGAVWFKHSLGLKFERVRFIDFTGAQIWRLNGYNDTENTQEIGCYECTFSPSSGADVNDNTTSIDINGWAASVDLTDTYVGPGGNGIWMHNDCSQSACSVDPSFVRITSRGFENGGIDSLRMDAGNHVQVNGTYIANDGPGYGIFQGPGFGEDLTVTGSLIRGTGASCVRLDAGYATITGNLLENCGRVNSIAVGNRLTVTGASGVGGLGGPIVLSYSSTNFSPNDGDIVFVNSVGGTTEANGTWYIAQEAGHVVLLGTTAVAAGTLTTTNGSTSATLNSTLWGTVASGQAIWGPGIAAGTTITRSGSAITLSQAATATGSAVLVNLVNGVSSFAHSWTSGGTIQLRTYGVQISGSASSVHVSANNIGTGRTGTNNSQNAVYNDSADAVVQNNWMPGYSSSAAYVNNNPTAVFRDNPGQEQVDGCAVVAVAGTLSTGALDFANIFQVEGRKILFTRQGGWTGAGTASVRVDAGGTGLTGSSSLTTTHSSALLTTPELVDGTSSPVQVQAHITAVAGSANSMKFQACYVNMD